MIDIAPARASKRIDNDKAAGNVLSIGRVETKYKIPPRIHTATVIVINAGIEPFI